MALLPAWLRGGTHAPWSWPFLWVALASLGALRAASFPLRRKDGRSAPFIRLRDPVLWLGLVLMAVLWLQWWNAGRALYYDAAARAWAYSPPRVPWLPSAITTAEARQMFDWFAPAWAILLIIRSPSVSGRAVRAIWRGLLYNGCALCVFGLVQFFSGTSHMYGFVPMRPHFFASFGYPNHAGSYFLMLQCIAAALAARELAPGGTPIRRRRVAVLGAAFLLSLIGANFALSRLSIIMSWVLLMPIGYFVLRAIWPRLDPARRVHVILISLATVVFAAFLTAGLGADAIRKEFKPEDDNKTFLERETNFRWFQLKTAAQIWWDHPWFGVGGWGYRYLIAHYLPREEWRRITEGKANVHNDPLQFLAEFGLVGGGAIFAIVAVLVADAWRRRAGASPMWVLPLLGVAVVAGQSLIDLPFRSPAVLALWVIILGGVPRALPEARLPHMQLNPLRRGDILRRSVDNGK
jgi:O-antigen ligase